jgi:hypothetical protein
MSNKSDDFIFLLIRFFIPNYPDQGVISYPSKIYLLVSIINELRTGKYPTVA